MARSVTRFVTHSAKYRPTLSFFFNSGDKARRRCKRLNSPACWPTAHETAPYPQAACARKRQGKTKRPVGKSPSAAQRSAHHRTAKPCQRAILPRQSVGLENTDEKLPVRHRSDTAHTQQGAISISARRRSAIERRSGSLGKRSPCAR